MRARDLLRPDVFARVERAVQEAERRTSGELIPMVVDRSSDYGGVRATAAAIAAFAAGLAGLALRLDPPLLWLPPLQLVAFAAGWWTTEWAGALRWLVPDATAAERVARAARVAFVEQGLHETRERTGILLYVSLLEHRVVVLADRGIDSRVEPGTWDGVVRDLLRDIRAGRPDEGLVEAIRRCGELLASLSPRRPDDRDELSGRLRVDRD
jgi:putative membrane protein